MYAALPVNRFDRSLQCTAARRSSIGFAAQVKEGNLPTALSEGMVLVTKDAKIRACKQLRTLW
jgi:hypothetical protein